MPGLGSEDVQEGMERAFDEFVAEYAEAGGHRYHGFSDYGDPRNYKGPLIWSEGDCALRFALALERHFPRMVHLEMPVARYTVARYDSVNDRRQFVDIVVSDLSDFDEANDVFSERRHDLFVEVKYIGRGGPRWLFDSRKKVPAIERDARRLNDHLDRGNCAVAAVLVVDDACVFEDELPRLAWPPSVHRLVASPQELERRAISAPSAERIWEPRTAAPSQTVD